MINPSAKIPLKNKTASSHLETLRRAVEIVNSWPKWKRERSVFRDKAAAHQEEEALCSEEERLQKRIA